MNKLTGWQWAGLLVLALFVVWVVGQYVNDPHDNDWTDPHQPPPMVPPMFGPSCGRQQRSTPRSKCYPASLADWDESCVGDV